MGYRVLDGCLLRCGDGWEFAEAGVMVEREKGKEEKYEGLKGLGEDCDDDSEGIATEMKLNGIIQHGKDAQSLLNIVSIVQVMINIWNQNPYIIGGEIRENMEVDKYATNRNN